MLLFIFPQESNWGNPGGFGGGLGAPPFPFLICSYVASYLKVRVGSCFLVMANQEREKLGLENPVVHDTDKAIHVALQAIRQLIRADYQTQKK